MPRNRNEEHSEPTRDWHPRVIEVLILDAKAAVSRGSFNWFRSADGTSILNESSIVDAYDDIEDSEKNYFVLEYMEYLRGLVITT
jgi:hypothetical protein